MYPGKGAQVKRSLLIKITLLTLVFTLGFFYIQHRNTVHQRLKLLIKKDSTNIVTIKPEAPAPATPAPGKTIYLTFDDGPNKGTQNVLDIINAEQLPATWFVIGEHVYGSRHQANVYDSIRKSAFVELANHSFTHAQHNKFSGFYAKPDVVLEDFKRCADSLKFSSDIVRTPGRNIWRVDSIRHSDNPHSIAAADSLEKNGYTVMGWDLEWHFTHQLQAIQSSEQMVSQIDSMFAHNRTRTANHLVLLAHDQVYSNAKDSASLHRLLSLLKAKGQYQFAFINRYPGIEKKTTTGNSGKKKKA